MPKSTTNKKVVDNFIEKHGLNRFLLLMDMFTQGKSNVEIAEEFKLTRERVRQLKNLMTTTVELVDPVGYARSVYRRHQ